MHCLGPKLSLAHKINEINRDGYVMSLNVLVRTEKKETDFFLFVDICMIFQVIFMQCKGSKAANLMDFLWQVVFTAGSKTALQESSQFDFSFIFSPHLCSTMDLTLSQMTERVKYCSGYGHCSLDHCTLDHI